MMAFAYHWRRASLRDDVRDRGIRWIKDFGAIKNH